MNKILFSVAVLLILLPALTSAATYYVSTTGSDTNPGTQAQPWKTIAKVNALSFSPGDSILFKRGEIWREQLTVPSSGSAGSPITFGAYGEGAYPIIDGEPDLKGWMTTGNWTDLGGNIWQKAHTSAVNPQQAYFDGKQYYMAANAQMVNATSRWFWGSNVYYVYATSNPATFYTSMKIPTVGTGDYWQDSSIHIHSHDYVDVENIEFRGGEASVDIQSCNHVNIHDCTIGQSAIFGVVLRENCTYVNIYNNTIDSDFHTAGTTVSDSSWQGDGIYTQSSGSASHCNFYGNTIRDWCHSGIQLKGGTSNGGTHDIEIYQNTITGTNANHGRGISLGQNSVLNRVHHNKVYDNYIYDTAMMNEFFGNDNEYYYNIIDTVRHDLYNTNAGGIAVWSSASATEVTQDNKIYNNVIYNVCSYGIYAVASGGHTLTGIDISNNIIMNWGMDYADYAITINNNSDNEPNIYNNNCLYKSGVTNVIGYRGTAKTIAQFNAVTTTDTVTDNIGSDPLFTNATGHDFHLLPGSPCINKGANVGLTQDYEGNTVPQGAAPDIGAFEYADITAQPVAGDINGDGKVDISDLVIVATSFGKSSGFDVRANVVSSTPEVIDIADLSFVARRFTG